jgi:hypothetical protein
MDPHELHHLRCQYCLEPIIERIWRALCIKVFSNPLPSSFLLCRLRALVKHGLVLLHLLHNEVILNLKHVRLEYLAFLMVPTNGIFRGRNKCPSNNHVLYICIARAAL